MTHDSNPAERERIDFPALVGRLERHAFAIERDMSASTLWSDLILCRDLLRALIKQQALSSPSVGVAEPMGWLIEHRNRLREGVKSAGGGRAFIWDTDGEAYAKSEFERIRGLDFVESASITPLFTTPPALVVDRGASSIHQPSYDAGYEQGAFDASQDHVPEVGNMISQDPQTDQCGSRDDLAVGATAALATETLDFLETEAREELDAHDEWLNDHSDEPDPGPEAVFVNPKTLLKLIAIARFTPTPPASTTLATGNEGVETTFIRDSDAVCTKCRWKGNHAPDCPSKDEPWPMIDIPAGELAMRAALSPPAGGKGVLVEITEEMVRDAYHAGYAMGGEDALNGVWRSDAWETSKTRAALTAALTPASDEVA